MTKRGFDPYRRGWAAMNVTLQLPLRHDNEGIRRSIREWIRWARLD